jgi:hypothetical protein
MSATLEAYKAEVMEVLVRQFPDRDPEAIRAKVDAIVDERVRKPGCSFNNDTTGADKQIDVLQFSDFLLGKHQPVFTPYGTAYKQHSNSINLIAAMLEWLMKSRKVAKKKMLAHVNDVDRTLHDNYDRDQKTIKLLANSYYGASGEKNCIFFNPRVGPSVTYTGRTIITASVMAFEQFLAGNCPFNDLSEALLFVERCMPEESQRSADRVWVLDNPPTHDELMGHLLSRFRKHPSDEARAILLKAVSSLDPYEVARVFFRNNLYEFLRRCANARKVLESLFASDLKVTNADHPAEDVLPYLKELWGYLAHFVYHDHIPEDHFQRAEQDPRAAVLVVDTDSNFINVDPFVRFCRDELGAKTKEDVDRVSVVNVVIYLLARVIESTYATLTRNMNIPEDKRPIINMKNELARVA